MLALPAHPGRVGLAFLAVGLLVGAVVALVLWRRLRPSFVGEAANLVAVVVTLAVASTVAATPFVAWRIVEDTRSNSRLTSAEAGQVGAEVAKIDPAPVATLGRLMPRRATYAVVASQTVGPQLTGFWEWAAYALLPRTQVAHPAQAQWILSWDQDPRTLGVRVAFVRTLVTHGGPAPHTYYLARVAR